MADGFYTPAPLGLIRASSWPEFFDCGLRWYAKNVLDIRHPTSARAHLGTAIHAGAAVWDVARVQGKAPDATAALETALDKLHAPDYEVAWEAGDLTPAEAEPIVRALLPAYAKATAGDTYAAVEVLAEALDVHTERGAVRLTGTVDRLRLTDDGLLAVRDLKTGARAVAADGTVVTAKHQMQTGVYRLLAGHALARAVDGPSEILGMQTGKAARVAVGEVPDELPALLGDEHTPGLIELAADTLARGRFLPNPASTLCSARYCPFHSRCAYHA